MRYPEDKIKDAILHPDLDVRDMAIRYFYGSTSPDHTVMPLAIQAIEQYGRTKAFSFTHDLNFFRRRNKPSAGSSRSCGVILRDGQRSSISITSTCPDCSATQTFGWSLNMHLRFSTLLTSTPRNSGLP